MSVVHVQTATAIVSRAESVVHVLSATTDVRLSIIMSHVSRVISMTHSTTELILTKKKGSLMGAFFV